LSRCPRRSHLCLAVLPLLLLVLAPPPARAQTLDRQETAALRAQLAERFEIVPLARGVGLVPRDTRGLVEIDEGVVSVEGRPLSGAELRERFGADAPLLLRVSYLSSADLRRLVEPAPPPTMPAAPPSAAPPPVLPGEAPVPPSAVEAPRSYRRAGARIGIGRSVTIAEDEEVTHGIVVLGGRLRIDGRVRDEVVVVGGNVELGPTADVSGDITVIGGEVTRAPEARFTGRVNDAAFGDWSGRRWRAWGPRVEFGGWLSLAAALTRIMLLALCVALVLLVARQPALRVGEAAAAAPWQAALLGFGAQILFVPLLIIVAVALAVTIIGIPFVAVLVPLSILAALLALLLGFAGMAGRLGRWIMNRSGGGQPRLLLATWLGLGIIVLPTLLARLLGVASGPFHYLGFSLLVAGAIVEYLAWTVGLGAVLMTGFGRWSTVPPPLPPQPPSPSQTPIPA
jgi:hypothetical protein